jgi:O-antigen ligase
VRGTSRGGVPVALVVVLAASALAGVALAFASDPRLGLVGLAAPLGLLVAVSPGAGVALLLFTLPLEELGALLPSGALTLKLLGVLVAGAWLLNALVRRRPIAVPRSALPLVLFVLWGAASTGWAADPAAATRGAATLVQLLLLYLIVLNVLDTPARLRRALHAHVAGGVLLAAFALWLTREGVLQAGRSAIVVDHELVLEPNALAAALLLPVAVCLTGGLDGTRTPLERLCLTMAGVVCVTVMVLTLSRGALIGLAVIALLVSLARRQPWLVVVAALIALPGLLIVGPQLADRLAEGVTLADRGAGRLDIWRVASVVIQSHPLLGVGLGCFPAIYFEYLSRAAGVSWRHALDIASGTMEKYPHNTFIGATAELGVVGLVLLLVIVAVHLRQALASWRFLAARRHAAAGLVLASLAGLAAVAVVGLSCDVAHRKSFWLALALTAVGRLPSAAGVGAATMSPFRRAA